MRGAGPGWVLGKPPAQTRRRGRAEHPGGRAGPSWGPGAAAMDMPPLAGKIAALSLGAVPVSYALNHVSTLSQCVRGCGGRGWGCGGGRREDLRAASLAPSKPCAPWPPRAWGQNGSWVRTPNRKSPSGRPRVCVLGIGVPL